MKPAERTAYHHGNLRDALIAAAIELIAHDGAEKLSVREAAKLVGVSPGAPFRHFPNRAALLTAVAEQATEKLRTQVEQALLAHADQPPLVRFGAIGHTYLQWAKAHPTHFRVISDRALIDYSASASMQTHNQWIRTQMAALLEQALGAHSATSALAQVAARAMVYGLARMAVDGHFPEWNLPEAASTGIETQTLDYFINLLQQQNPHQRDELAPPAQTA